MELQSRKLFLWKIGVRDQKERVFEMRRWNEALVTNMLPEHVAKHFLGSKKRDEVNLSVCQVAMSFRYCFGGMGIYSIEKIKNMRDVKKENEKCQIALLLVMNLCYIIKVMMV